MEVIVSRTQAGPAKSESPSSSNERREGREGMNSGERRGSVLVTGLPIRRYRRVGAAATMSGRQDTSRINVAAAAHAPEKKKGK
jgi:hypothetical protein